MTEPGLEAVSGSLGSGLIFWVIVLSFFALLTLYLAFKNFIWARLIEDTPTARIRSAPQGYVELSGTGTLMPGPEIRSPLSGRPCLWYSYKVERRSSGLQDDRSARRAWDTVQSGVSDELFELRDETGTCVIDPDGASITSSHDRMWYGDVPHPSVGPPRRERLPVLRLLDDFIPIFGLKYRYTEQLIVPGDRLYVLGEFETLGTDHQADLKQDLGALLRSWKRDPERMKAFDEDGDGSIDGQEWGKARAAAYQQVLLERAERSVIAVTNVIRKPRLLHRPFLISNRPQTHLARHFRIRALASITGFFVATVIGFSLVLGRLGG